MQRKKKKKTRKKEKKTDMDTTILFQMKRKKVEVEFRGEQRRCVFVQDSLLGLLEAICVLFFIRGTPEPAVALFVRLLHRIDRLVGATTLPDQ